ncbi:MAG: GyrI-like domain-containing protein [Bacteroidota bacterium]|jgi:hypothetical protein
MKKIDYQKGMQPLYSASSNAVAIINIPSLTYLLVDGTGDPNTTKEYVDAIEVLYAVSYTIKFMIKKGELNIDYRVLPLEGLWWVPKMEEFSTDHKEDWHWRMMIMQPEIVTQRIFNDAMEAVRKKKHFTAMDALSYTSYNEGKCAQLLHVGPYRDEKPTIDRLHEYIALQGFKRRGKHHEIYLNDPRKTLPEKLKTIIRQPIQ